MFGWLFSAKKETKTIAIIDIQSGSVGGAITTLNRAGPPDLLFSIREELPLSMKRTAQSLSKETLIAVGHVFERLRKEAILYNDGGAIVPKKIEHVAVFLGAPWSETSLRQLKFSRSKPFTMTEGILKKMLADEAKTTASHIKAEMRLIEKVALGLRLNGYPVNNISKAPITHAEVTLAASLMPDVFAHAVVEVLGALPSGVLVTFHSNTLPNSYTLSSLFPKTTDALIIDAHAEITEVVHLKDASPVARGTVPVGTNLFLRTCLSHAHMSKKETQTALKLANIDGTRFSETYRALFSETAKDWLKAVQEMVRLLTHGAVFPQAVYLITDPHIAPWLVGAIEGDALIGSKKKTSPIQVYQADASHFSGKILVHGSAPDPSLSVKALYADARFDNDHILSLLSTEGAILQRPANATMAVYNEFPQESGASTGAPLSAA